MMTKCKMALPSLQTALVIKYSHEILDMILPFQRQLSTRAKENLIFFFLNLALLNAYGFCLCVSSSKQTMEQFKGMSFSFSCSSLSFPAFFNFVFASNFITSSHQGVHKNSFRNVREFQDRIGIWKCWFLMRGENRSTRRKTSRSRVENQKKNYVEIRCCIRLKCLP